MSNTTPTKPTKHQKRTGVALGIALGMLIGVALLCVIVLFIYIS